MGFKDKFSQIFNKPNKTTTQATPIVDNSMATEDKVAIVEKAPPVFQPTIPIDKIIKTILQQRHAQQPQLASVKNTLQTLEDQLNELQTLAEDKDSLTEELKNIIEIIAQQITATQTELQNFKPTFDNLMQRFAKKTINVGVVGQARQGKSTLLQQISGLPNTVIPTSNALPCTGSKSKIYHSEGQSHAEVEFYSNYEFFKEILYPYFDQLYLPKPQSPEDFKQPLPESDITASESQNLDKAVYEALKHIHQAFPHFSHYLSQPKKEINLKQIAEFVTQSKAKTAYLAVKQAHVYTKFPNHDVTGLCLVDLPGLEAAQAHEQKLINALEHEVDAVIFVKSPDILGTDWEKGDYQIFDLIDNAVKEVDLEDFLFIVLNIKKDDSNRKQVEILQTHPPKTYTEPTILAANCTDVDAVENQVFSPILTHLSENLTDIDQQVVEHVYAQLDGILDNLLEKLQPATNAFNIEQSILSIDSKYFDLFEEFMNDLKVALEDLIYEIQQELKDAAEEFKQKVTAVCDTARQDSPVPPYADLERQYKIYGGWNRVVEEQLNYARAHLTQVLTKEFDTYLQDKVDYALQKLLNRIFPPAFQKIFTQDIDNPRALALALRENLDKTQYPRLHESFDYIVKFHFSYHSHFHYRVRREMEALDTYSGAVVNEIIASDAHRGNVAEKASEVARGLDERYQHTIYQVHKRLTSEDMQTDPAHAVFALVEELKDRLARSKGINKEWQMFLNQLKEQVWEETFSQFDKENELRKSWQMALQKSVDSIEQLKVYVEQ